MTLRDYIVISTGNLWRMKLRTVLTIAGILIAIAAFVAMLSFGAGNQAYVEQEFNKLGLLTTMQVYPKKADGNSDSSTYPKLDKAALEKIASVAGVNLVYPYDALAITIKHNDSTVTSRAQALPTSALRTKLFSGFVTGNAFTSDSAKEVIISDEVMKDLGFTSPESAMGKLLTVSVKVSTIDSGLVHILADNNETLFDRLKRIHYDSLLHRPYRSKVFHTEINAILRRFTNGFMNAQQVITETLSVCGVRELTRRAGKMKIEPMIIPITTARRFSTTGFSGNPAEIFSSLSAGTLFSEDDGSTNKSFSQVTVDFDPKVPYKSIQDSVEALGFRTFSFAAQFEEIQRVFIYFDMGLGVVGLIALITASLGIVNTMVMSIIERRKEIGVLKSLGADERDIRFLFLAESGVIGMLGIIGGIFSGWTITRIISAIVQRYMKSEGLPAIDLFALPVWLILIAMGVGLTVSILAGFYPAARAARVDPVEALRND